MNQERPAAEAAGVVVPDVPPLRTVSVPSSDSHAGLHRVRVTLVWACPVCGGPRGEPRPAISYDGSRRLAVDGWENPCGHVDLYRAVRREAGLPA